MVWDQHCLERCLQMETATRQEAVLRKEATGDLMRGTPVFFILKIPWRSDNHTAQNRQASSLSL